MLRKFVALTPLAGSILLPFIVLVTIARVGLGPGLLVALLLSSLWFILMLRTAEMPH